MKKLAGLRFLCASLLTLGSLLSINIAVAEEPIRFAVTDILGLEELQRDFDKFKAVLERVSGKKMEFFPVSNRTVAANALRGKRLDLVLTGPAEYVVLREKAKAVPVVALSRPDYFSAIITKAESGIHSVNDLRGKKVGLGQFGSTSYYFAPLQLIYDNNLNAEDDLEVLNLSKHLLWKSLNRGDVDAIGMNHERFREFRSQEKKVAPGSYRVIARGPDLPSDLIVAGKHVSEADVATFRKAFTEGSDELIGAILTAQRNNKYEGMRFVANVKDSDYNYVRKMYATAGLPEFAKQENG